MGLDKLRARSGSRQKRKRVGRGPGSGNGKTAGRGHKGQLSRSGVSIFPGFEGGQMPLQRRMPKRGFTNHCRRKVTILNCRDLNIFEENAVVDPEAMCRAGLVGRKTEWIKILSNGDLGKKLTVCAQSFSQKAKEKIEAAGGTAEVISQIKRFSKSTPSADPVASGHPAQDSMPQSQPPDTFAKREDAGDEEPAKEG
jgi:large subunit ribosomal protein L15